MIKRFLIAFVLLFLVAGGLVGFNMFRDRAIQQFFAARPVPTVTVSTVTAEPRAFTPTLEAIGTANALHGVDLAVETTGVVREIRFAANARVKAGDVLLQLDDDVEQADLAAARAQADLDRQTLSRARELRSRNVGSEVSLQAAEAAAAASQAQVARLQAVLEQKQLRAPFDGVIGIPRVDVGQYLAPGTVVATLQDLETIRADFSLPEQQFASIAIGQRVRLSLDDGAEPLTGEIIGIDPKVDPASRLVSVRARIDGARGRVIPGQFAQLSIELPRQEGVITVPQTAIVTSLYGDHVYVVRRVGEGDAHRLEVRQSFVATGRRTGGLVEITSGVAAGDIVVNAGQNRLSNGTPVTIDNSVDPVAGRDPAGEGAAEQPDAEAGR